MVPDIAARFLRDIPLAPLTTFELGGHAALYLEAADERTASAALHWARQNGTPVAILGGGSNLIVGDAGFDGLVLALRTRGIVETRGDDSRCRLRVAAGVVWDELVARSVARNQVGLEALSGIPGRVGASPIQNIGAYGQEVSRLIAQVEAIDRHSLERRVFSNRECLFRYRDSRFKSEEPDRYLIVAVVFDLDSRGVAPVRYAELERSLGDRPRTPATIREHVLALRAAKSMIYNTNDPNHRSAGSFFTNPILDLSQYQSTLELATRGGHIESASELPCWPQPDGRFKLAAGWLVERAGFRKGERIGAFGLSTGHALCIVHHGGGTTRELLDFSERIAARVYERFDVRLEREPVSWR